MDEGGRREDGILWAMVELQESHIRLRRLGDNGGKQEEL